MFNCGLFFIVGLFQCVLFSIIMFNLDVNYFKIVFDGKWYFLLFCNQCWFFLVCVCFGYGNGYGDINGNE